METSAPTDSRPALWNPTAAAFWSLLFTPIFGALLHARNARALGHIHEARANLAWAALYLLFLVFLLAANSMPVLPSCVFSLPPIVLIITWYLTVAHRQVRFVKTTFGNDYRHKSWVLPILAGIGGLIVIFVLYVALALVTEAISTEPARS